MGNHIVEILFTDEGQTEYVQMTLSTHLDKHTQTGSRQASTHTYTHTHTYIQGSLGGWIAELFMRLEHPRLWTPLSLESEAGAQITFSAQLKQGCG